MQYLLLTFLAAVLAAIVWTAVGFTGMKRRLLQRIVGKKIIDGPYFSTLAVRELVNFICSRSGACRRQLLQEAVSGNFTALQALIKDPLLRAKVRLMAEGAAESVPSPDTLYLLMQCGLLWKNRRYDAARSILCRTERLKLNSGSRALRSLNVAAVALYEGDLLAASSEASSALNFFRRQDMLFEEAGAYFLLGTIYRVSGVFDTAEFMLRSALKIYHFLDAASREAETLGTLGMLLAAQERFDEAAANMERAEELFAGISDNENRYFVVSRRALLELQRGNADLAKRLAGKALKKHRSRAGRAFASDVLAQTAFAAGNWRRSAEYASDAAEKYFRERNFAAGFECLYLAAEANMETNNLDEAEDILRRLIRKEPYHQSCFHVAAAYTLLGLILLRKNDAKRARAIFNQALKRELYNNRDACAAVDYANLAAVEKKCGNRAEAHKNLEAALAYAREVDEKLYDKIKAVLD